MAFRRLSMPMTLLVVLSAGPSMLAASAAPSPTAAGQVQFAFYTSGSRGSVGIHFLGSLTSTQARDLGVPSPNGALVDWVRPGSGAEKAGLKVEDFVVEINGRVIEAPQTLTSM